MANNNPNLLITTVQDNNYPVPTQRDGQWVVSASSINRDPNKAILFNPNTKVYTDITPQSVTPDYFAQTKKYERTLDQIYQGNAAKQKGIATSSNPNEVNSFADVITAGSENVYSPEGATNVIKNLEDQNYLGALKSAWDMSYLKSFGRKAEAFVDLIENTVLDPITKNDLSFDEDGNRIEVPASLADKGFALFNNSLVNLGETIDLVTGANVVKGLIQEGPSSLSKGFGDVYGSGRYQYDWNLNPTGTILDTGINMLLELVSDPTNWISFGASSAIKGVGKSSFGDVILKSADDAGVALTRAQADDLAQSAVKSFIKKDDSIVQAIRRTDLNNVLSSPATKEQIMTFFESVPKNAELIKDAKTLTTLKSIRTNTDAVQAAAMKAVGYSSGLGLGANLVKGLWKGAQFGIGGLSYVVSKLNKMQNDFDISKLNLANYDEFVNTVEKEITTMSKLMQMSDEYPSVLIRRVTENFQRQKYSDIQKIITKNDDITKRLKELDVFAKAEGFTDLDTMIKELANRRDIVPEGYLHIAQELENEIYNAIRTGRTQLFTAVRDAIDPSVFYRRSTTELKEIMSKLEEIQGMANIKTYVSEELLNSVYSIAKYTKSTRHALEVQTTFQHVVDTGLFLPTLFSVGAVPKDTIGKALEGVEILKAKFGKTISAKKIDALELALRMLWDTDTIGVEVAMHARQIQKEILSDIHTLATQVFTGGRTLEETKAVWKGITARRAELSDLRSVLNKAINDINEVGKPGAGIRTVVSDITNKAVKDVYDAFHKAFVDQGIPMEKLKEAVVQLSKFDLDKPIVTYKDSDELHQTIVNISKIFKNRTDTTYFFDSELVDELLSDWFTNGFTINMGNTIVGQLDELLEKLSPRSNVYRDVEGAANVIQTFIDVNLMNSITDTKFTPKQMMSKMYTIKQSHIKSVVDMLSAPHVEEAFDDIFRNQGIGSFIDTLADYDTEEFITDSVKNLQSVSKSIYVARKALDLIKRSNFSPEWKDGLYDTLAGMVRDHRDHIYSAEDFTYTMISKAKTFIDNKNNAHPSRLHDLSETRDTLEEAQELYRHAFTDYEAGEEASKRWKPVYDALHKDESQALNIVYSAQQTYPNSGQIYEFAFVLEDGSYGMFIDKSAKDMVFKHLDDTTAKALYGKSANKVRLDFLENAKRHAGNPAVIEFDNTMEFAKAIHGMLDNAKTVAKEKNLVPRLVGYNSALDSLGTDKALSDFVYKNMLNTHIVHNESTFNSLLAVETLDAAQYMRIAHDGAITYTDAMYKELLYMVTNLKDYLDKANMGEPFSKTYLMPDFTRNTTASLREVIAAVRNADRLMQMETAGMYVQKSDFVSLSEAQYGAVKAAYSVTDLRAMESDLTVLLESIGDTLLGIKQTNQILGQVVLVQDSLSKLLGEPNVMQILTKYLVTGPGVPAYSLKTLNNPDTLTNWFTKVSDEPSVLSKMNDIASRMQDKLSRIKHHSLILSLPNFELTKMVARLKEIYLGMAGRKYNAWNEIFLQLKSGDDKLQNYLIAVELWNKMQTIAKAGQMDLIKDDLIKEFPDSGIVHYVSDAENTALYNKPLYVPGLDVLHSTQISDSNEIFQKVNELSEILSDVRKQETLTDMIDLDNALRQTTDNHNVTARAKEHITKTYAGFVNEVKAYLNDALSTYRTLASEIDDAGELLRLRQDYSKSVDRTLEILKELTIDHAFNRTQTILSMTAPDYAMYLYKYAQGIQIINLNADVFTKNIGTMQPTVAKFMETLEEARVYGVEYIENRKRGELYVFINSKSDRIKALEDAAEKYTLPKTDIVVDHTHPIASKYGELVKALDVWTNGEYHLSTHRTMNTYRYDELLEYLPNVVKNNLLSKDYLEDNDLLTGKFAQTIVGDYADGVNTIFSTYSGNLVTNVAAGFNAVYNNIRGKEMYKSLFFNYTNQLSYWIDSLKKYRVVTHKEVLDAVTSRNMVIAKINDAGQVVKVDITHQAAYEEALKSGAVMLDYHSYTRAIEVLNNNKLNSKFLTALNKNYLAPLKIAQLLSPGWVMRNIPDSTIKGWVQSGLDPMYMTSIFTRTLHTIKQYDYTYRLVLEQTGGSLTADNIKAFYKTLEDYKGGARTGLVADIAKRDKLFKDLQAQDVLNETVFRKMLSFYNSSSAQATPAQMNLYNNLAYNLFQKVKGNPKIKEDDVQAAIQIFMNYPSSTSARVKLLELYEEDIATDLMLLKKFVGKELAKDTYLEATINKVRPLKKLMDVNTSFESVIRMHTFLYNTVYTNGTMSDAWKMVDESQFNRAYDTKATHVLETLLPFSSFQLDNFFYWLNVARHPRGNAIAAIEDVLSGWSNEEEMDTEEMSRNMSLQYLFETGNLILNDETGSNIKINDSVHNTIGLVTNPIGTFAQMLNVPIKVAQELVTAMNADPEAYKEDSFKNPKPYSEYTGWDKADLYTQLIPLVGVLYQRQRTAWTKGKLEPSDLILPILVPSIFGVTKLDSAGTTYQSRPIGTDWYDRDQTYKDAHRFVYGISYKPAWMQHDPTTYVNTYQRLLQLGYSEETATTMMQSGWFISYPDYELKQYQAGRIYPKMVYAKRSYLKAPKKFRKVYLRSNRPAEYETSRVKLTRTGNYRRVYRNKTYNDLYTRTGVARENLVAWRGANRSSRQLIIDRTVARRNRTKRIIRQIRGR